MRDITWVLPKVAARRMQKKKSLEPSQWLSRIPGCFKSPFPKSDSFFHAKLATWKLNCISLFDITLKHVSSHLWLPIFSIHFIYFKPTMAFRMLDSKIEFKYFWCLWGWRVLVWEASNQMSLLSWRWKWGHDISSIKNFSCTLTRQKVLVSMCWNFKKVLRMVGLWILHSLLSQQFWNIAT